MTLLTILTPCFNEEGNVRELYEPVKAVMCTIPDLDYDHLFIDNASTDRTVPILREFAAEDKRVKVIVNTRNFGQVRSPYHAFLEARGDAIMAAWPISRTRRNSSRSSSRSGARATRSSSASRLGAANPGPWPGSVGSTTGSWPTLIRRAARRQLHRLRSVRPRRSWSSSGGPASSTPTSGAWWASSATNGPRSRTSSRHASRGQTKNNFLTLYDLAMMGITSHSKIPLRLATMAGFALSILSLLMAVVYLILKLVWWETFDLGLAPLVIGVYFFGAIQLFFIGMLGEYIGSIHTQVHQRPHVVERERINFDQPPGGDISQMVSSGFRDEDDGERPEGSETLTRTSTRLLVIGASGLLGGEAVLAGVERGYEVVGVTAHTALHPPVGASAVIADVAAPGVASDLVHDVRPTWILNAAAAVEVDALESDPERADRLNCVSRRSLPTPPEPPDRGSSTSLRDSVFDGEVVQPYTEDIDPRPLNVYGRSKWRGEQGVGAVAPQALIARTTIFGWNATAKLSLAEWFLAQLESGLEVTGFTDAWFSPINTAHLVEELLNLLAKPAWGAPEGFSGGVLHLAGGECITKYEFGRRLAAVFGHDPEAIKPGRMWATPSRRHGRRAPAWTARERLDSRARGAVSRRRA